MWPTRGIKDHQGAEVPRAGGTLEWGPAGDRLCPKKSANHEVSSWRVAGKVCAVTRSLCVGTSGGQRRGQEWDKRRQLGQRGTREEGDGWR